MTMKELLTELSALALYLKSSGSDKGYKVNYAADKLEILVKKCGGEDDRQN